MVTIKDIANRLGISVSTVSKGINGASDISDELRQQVLDTAIEMGYRSKRMRREQNKRLCIFIENMSYESDAQFGYELVLGFRQAALRDNWDVTVIPVTPELQQKERYDVYMLKNGYSGAFLLGFALQDDWMEQFSSTTIPTVLLDNYIPKNPHVSYIGTDNYEGIDLAVAHLAELGHTRIAFLNGSPYSLVSDQREQAFLRSMESHHLTPDRNLMGQGYYVPESAKYHVSHFLENGATAILCGSDLIASGVIAECQAHGFSVPEDISVTGFDDLPISAQLNPPLTTVRQDRAELGKCGYYTLHSLMCDVSISRTLMRPQLIARASTKKRENIS